MNLVKRIEEIEPSLKYWQTEYSLLEKGYFQGNASHKEVSEMDCAIFLARVIHYDFVVSRASSWQFWSSFHPELHGGLPRFNLITAKSDQGKLRAQATKLFWSLGHFSRWIRPGMRRFPVNFSSAQEGFDKDLLVSAYGKDSKHIQTLVLVNQSNKAKKVRLPENISHSYKKYVTTADQKRNMRFESRVQKNQFFIVPARSIVTLAAQN